MPIPGLDTWFASLILFGSLIFLVIFILTRFVTGSFGKAFKFWGVIIGVLLIFAAVGTVWHKITTGLEKKKQEEQLQAFLEESTPYFKEKCKKVGIFIYDTNIPSQDSVYIMKPISLKNKVVLSSEDKKSNQYIKHDFFNHWVEPGYLDWRTNPSLDGNPTYLISQWPNAGDFGFDYVEMYLDEPTNLVRFEYIPDPKKYAPNDTKSIKKPIDKITSRYGTSWEDISTKEDRDHWVAGGKRQVIDLQTNKVVAEAIGYVMARNPGVFSWKGYSSTCPEKYDSTEFVWSVLRSKEYKKYLNRKGNNK